MRTNLAEESLTPLPSASRTPQLTLLGKVMRDHYQIASIVLAFARSSALDRERCWALALGGAQLATCANDAMMCVERNDSGALRVRLYGTWKLDIDEPLALTLGRLRDLGFRTRPSSEQNLLLEIIAAA